MSLHFQRQDEVDRVVKEQRRRARWPIAFVLALFAVSGIIDWLDGKSIKSFGFGLELVIVLCWLVWLVGPIFHAFSIRTKETYGMVSAIESSMTDLKERDAELLKRLTAIENRLEEIQDANRT